MKYILSALLTLALFQIPFKIYAQEQKIPEGLSNLSYRNEKLLNEIVYLHTDREVYAPSDTLYFKAYIRDLEKLQPSSLSQTLFVNLVDDVGNIIEKSRYLIEDSDTKGQFILDHKMKEGIYFITAYSSWMKNFDPGDIFKKKFQVRFEQKRGFQMVLTMDRNSYYPGDSIIAFVQCFDEQNRNVSDVKYTYRVFAGTETFAKGKMRTSSTRGDSIIFSLGESYQGMPFMEVIASHKGQNLDTSVIIPATRDIHVDFFPEGGSSLIGFESDIAFKAQNQSGDPIQIHGVILDQNGVLVTHAFSEHLGMGSFRITPAYEQDLSLQILDPPGFDQHYPIPKALDHGWQLAGTADIDKIKLLVNRKDTPGEIALITLMVRGYLSSYKQLKVDSSLILEIPTAGLPPGIAVLTLFDQEMQPQAERLFHIRPGKEIDIDMQTDRPRYRTRDRVKLDIQMDSILKDWDRGSYSISIVDAPLGLSGSINEGNIPSTFLFSPEIKGKVQDPGYYLDQEDPEVRKNFDLLLRTQGWRNYKTISGTDWKNEVAFPRDQEKIYGVLFKQAFGKDPAPSKGEINIYFGGNSQKVHVNENGNFSFRPEYDMDYNSGILMSGEVKGSSSYVSLRVDQSQFDQQLPEYLFNLMDSIKDFSLITASDFQSIADRFSLGLAYHEWIEEVSIIKSARSPKSEDYDIIIEDFITQHKVEARPEYIETAIDVIGILYNMGIPVNYLPDADAVEHLAYPRTIIGWVVDDSYYGTNFSFVQNFVPRSIDRLTLVKFFETQYFGPNMPEVVVSIRLKTFDPDDIDPDQYLSKYIIPEFKVAKEFYKPLYNTEQKRASTLPDIRKTIHWEPDLKIDRHGHATLDFYNGDRYTKVTCILEGITEKGMPVYKEFDYEVSLNGQ